jgi:hypothetical protein
MRPFLYFVL